MKRLIYYSILLTLVLSSCRKAELSTTMNEVFYVRNQGADMPAYVHGNGTNKTFILVLHGGPGGNGLEYRSGTYASELEKEYAMVYWDQRGQGSASGNYNANDMNLALLTDDLYKLVLVMKQRYGEDINIFLMGHSWGGMLGTSFMITENYQELVKGWIEVDGAHDIPYLNQTAVDMFITIGEAQILAEKNVDKWQPIVDFAKGLDVNNITIDQSGQINQYAHEAEGLLDEIQRSGQGSGQGPIGKLFFSPTNLIASGLSGNVTSNQLVNEVDNTSLTDQLHKIQQPCLFLWGKYDFVVPPALGNSAYSKISSSSKRYVEFESSGHSPMDNEAELFVDEVKQFIEQHK